MYAYENVESYLDDKFDKILSMIWYVITLTIYIIKQTLYYPPIGYTISGVKFIER
jgi:hypothetical protein